MAQNLRVGIPRALLYHKYGAFWESYFKELGCAVIVSPPTTRAILDAGLQVAIDESCLSIKIYLGHVRWLAGKVDYVFVPRIASLKKNEELCTKFQGLYDIVHNTFPDIPLLDCNIDQHTSERDAYLGLGKKITGSSIAAWAAYLRARRAVRAPRKATTLPTQDCTADLRILIVAHPYSVHDAFVGGPIIKYLTEHGATPIYADAVDADKAWSRAGCLSKDLYWTTHKELLGALDMLRADVDGVLFLSTFPCGPDALFIDYCVKKYSDIPLVVLTLDEQQGDAGLRTRLESFLDILRMRRAACAA